MAVSFCCNQCEHKINTPHLNSTVASYVYQEWETCLILHGDSLYYARPLWWIIEKTSPIKCVTLLQMCDILQLREGQGWYFTNGVVTQIPAAIGSVGGAGNIQPRPPRNYHSKFGKLATYTFQNPGHSHEFISLGTYFSRWEVQSIVPVRVLHKQSSGHAQPSGYCATAKLARVTSVAANCRRTKAIFQLNFVLAW